MRHGVDGRKLGRTNAHRKALYRNLVIALIAHERIHTTTPKAKEARRLAERLITFAKRGDLAARRHVARILHDKQAVQKLFAELGPRYAARAGGYTRVLKLGRWRRGDNAELALLELVTDHDHTVGKAPAEGAEKGAKGAAAAPQKKAAGKKAAAKPAAGKGAGAKPARKAAGAKPAKATRGAAPKSEKPSRAKGLAKSALSGAGKKRGASKGKGSGD